MFVCVEMAADTVGRHRREKKNSRSKAQATQTAASQLKKRRARILKLFFRPRLAMLASRASRPGSFTLCTLLGHLAHHRERHAESTPRALQLQWPRQGSKDAL